MNINNTLQYNITPLSFGRNKNNKVEPEQSNNEQKRGSGNILPRLCLATAGFFVSAGVLVSTAYDALDTSPRVESEQTSFDNRADAMQYAKKKITAALNKDYPREYMVYIDKYNNILGEFNGNDDSVYGDLLFFDMLKTKIPGYYYSSVHGHPGYDGLSTPISCSDFEILNNENALKEVIAINKNGEYSLLRKKDDFEPLDFEKLYDIRHSLWDRLKEESQEKMPDKWKDVGKIISHDEFFDDKYTEQDVICEYQTTPDGINCIHNFWKENAPKINLEYKTNYSYLD